MSFRQEQAELPPADMNAQPDGMALRNPLDYAMNALRGGKLATLAMAVLAPLGASAMLAPVAGAADHQPQQARYSRPHSQPVTFGPGISFSFDMCGGWGDRICTTGCGDVVSADFVSDLTVKRTTPLDVLPILSPDYYIPGSGTKPEGFAVVAEHYGLEARPGSLQSAKEALKAEGGVAVAEFNNGVAISRSGDSSSVAVNDHYVVLDKVTSDGRFAMADPHQGAGRYNEKTPNGQIRFWTRREMKQEGLINVWTITP